MSVDAQSAEQIDHLPQTLLALSRKPSSLDKMRRRLHCARSFLWYASIYGACAEGLQGAPDAFDGLMAILASRLSAQRDRISPAAAVWKAACYHISF